jgi:ATP-dependent protease ClpP protease subunit
MGSGYITYRCDSARVIDRDRSRKVLQKVVIAYLGGERRLVSKHATFMIHRSTFNAQPATTTNLANATRILAIEDARTEAMLRERANLSDAQWTYLDRHDLWLGADEAVAAGVAHAITEYAPPKGVTLLII